MDAGKVFHVAGQPVQFFDNHDVDVARPHVVQHLQQAVAPQNRGARLRRVRIAPNQVQPLGRSVPPDKCFLVGYGSFVLQICRIAAVADCFPGHWVTRYGLGSTPHGRRVRAVWQAE
nr:hypothetical protein [Paracoccus sediminilitoris]